MQGLWKTTAVALLGLAAGRCLAQEAPGAALRDAASCRALGERARQHLRESPWEQDRAEFYREPVYCALQVRAWDVALDFVEAGLAEATTPVERATFLDLKARALRARGGDGDGAEAAATLHLLRTALQEDESPEAVQLRFFAAMDLAADGTRAAHPQEGADPDVDRHFALPLSEAPSDKDRADVYTLWAEVYARSRFLEAPARRALELLNQAEPLLTFDLKPPVLHLRALLERSLGDYAAAREDVAVALISTGAGALREDLLHLQRLLEAPEVRFAAQPCGDHLCMDLFLRNVDGADLEVFTAKGRIHRENLCGAVDPRGLARELAWPLPKKVDPAALTRVALTFKGAVLAEVPLVPEPAAPAEEPSTTAPEAPGGSPAPVDPAAPGPAAPPA